MLLTVDHLIALMRNPEDNLTERKSEGFKPEELRRTVVAFANSVAENATSVVFIGVEDDGRPVGVADPDSIQKRVNSVIADCYPPIDYVSRVLVTEGVNVVALLIGYSANRPHFAGPSYVRQGSQSVKASDAQFQELLYSRTGKVRSLLNMRGPLITIELVESRLNSPLRLGGYHAQDEGHLVKCDDQTVTLQNVGGLTVTLPIARVIPGFDQARNRALVIVRPQE